MELINQTPVVADVRVAAVEETKHRYGMLVAKATFHVLPDGSTRIDGQDPIPLFEEDEPTEFGLMPQDSVPRRDPKLEVIVLGQAYADGRAQTLIELTVGGARQNILVSGDRRWVSHQRGGRYCEPQPFETMPMTWERAFGGTAECWIDAESAIDLDHPMNKYGRGFNAYKLSEDVGKAFQSPSGYPQLSQEYVRWLPNLEHPQQAISRWEDEPRPYCWATIPTDIGVHLQRAHDYLAQHERSMSQAQMLRMVYHRAHPDWILDIPPMDTIVSLSGMTPSQNPRFAFRIPRIRVLADYEFGERSGTRELEPHMLLLLPEQSRFYVVFRHFFTIADVEKDMSRSWRLRLAEGWFQP